MVPRCKLRESWFLFGIVENHTTLNAISEKLKKEYEQIYIVSACVCLDEYKDSDKVHHQLTRFVLKRKRAMR